MDITRANLETLFTNFSTAFNKGFNETKPFWPSLAMKVNSTSAATTYGWLGDMPGIRKWLGDRIINDLSASKYTIINELFEETISVRRTSVEDDQYGIYGPLFTKLGYDTAMHPDSLLFELLKAGSTTLCFDGHYFFDTDHSVGTGDKRRTVANYQPGSSTPWYLFDCGQPIKPLIYQERLPFKLTRLDSEEDENVFTKDLYVHGVRGRSNAGFGLWQLAYQSNQPLTEANYDAARTAMQLITNDAGKPLGVRPTHLLVPPQLEGTARRLLEGENKTGGESNIWAKTAEIVVSPYLG